MTNQKKFLAMLVLSFISINSANAMEHENGTALINTAGGVRKFQPSIISQENQISNQQILLDGFEQMSLDQLMNDSERENTTEYVEAAKIEEKRRAIYDNAKAINDSFEELQSKNNINLNRGSIAGYNLKNLKDKEKEYTYEKMHEEYSKNLLNALTLSLSSFALQMNPSERQTALAFIKVLTNNQNALNQKIFDKGQAARTLFGLPHATYKELLDKTVPILKNSINYIQKIEEQIKQKTQNIVRNNNGFKDLSEIFKSLQKSNAVVIELQLAEAELRLEINNLQTNNKAQKSKIERLQSDVKNLEDNTQEDKMVERRGLNDKKEGEESGDEETKKLEVEAVKAKQRQIEALTAQITEIKTQLQAKQKEAQDKKQALEAANANAKPKDEKGKADAALVQAAQDAKKASEGAEEEVRQLTRKLEGLNEELANLEKEVTEEEPVDPTVGLGRVSDEEEEEENEAVSGNSKTPVKKATSGTADSNPKALIDKDKKVPGTTSEAAPTQPPAATGAPISKEEQKEEEVIKTEIK